ncbi:MAG TPA: phosphate ABC transporter substrate-binding protein [Bacteroidia bacterium]|nr:phosphate ABC transporter substrate-binding protein [Bacteroidia bacterium]
MKKIVPVVVLGLALMSGCSRDTETIKRDLNQITICGSESEKPLAVLLTDEYHKQKPEITFDVKGGGSDAGIKALLDRKTDVALSSRLISDVEMGNAATLDVNVHQVIVAVEAVAIITHPSVGVEFITVADLAAVYDGRIRNWKELGGPDMEIYPVGRKHGSGTRSYMLHRLSIEEFCPQTIEFETYEDILSTVKTNRGAIAYISSRFISYAEGRLDPAIWVMNVSLNGMPFISPVDREAIEYGDYALMRPLFQYYSDDASKQLMDFIDFQLSDVGQKLVVKFGYHPINDYHREINKRNSIDSVSSTKKVTENWTGRHSLI